MELNRQQRKKAIKDVLGGVYILLSKFSSNQSLVIDLIEMYWGKPDEREWGVLGQVYYWQVKGKTSSKFEGSLRLSIVGSRNSKIVDVLATEVTKKEMNDGSSEARYYASQIGRDLPLSHKYIVGNLDDAIDCYIDLSDRYNRVR